MCNAGPVELSATTAITSGADASYGMNRRQLLASSAAVVVLLLPAPAFAGDP